MTRSSRSSSSSACPVTHCHAGCQEWVHLWLVKEICGEGVSLSSSWLWDEVTSVSSTSEGNMRWSCVSVSLSRAGKTKEILCKGKSVSLSSEGDLRRRWVRIFLSVKEILRCVWYHCPFQCVCGSYHCPYLPLSFCPLQVFLPFPPLWVYWKPEEDMQRSICTFNITNTEF